MAELTIPEQPHLPERYELPKFKPGESIPIMRPEMHIHLKYLLRELDLDPDGADAATIIYAHVGRCWPATFDEGLAVMQYVVNELNTRNHEQLR